MDAAPPQPPRVEGAATASGGALALAVGGAAKRPGKAFVDFHNDVTARDIALAAREGMRSIEHIKRYTTAGMGADQGKATNLNVLAIAASALGKPIAEVGLTTFRQPYAPVTFGAFAGLARRDLFDPIRETPLHGWAARRGAVFEDAGQWKRASRFPTARRDGGSDAQARMPGDARRRRHPGRFDARQDRGRRPRRGRVPQSPLRQFVRQAARSGAAATR